MKEVCWYLLGDPDKVITIAEFEALLASNYWHHEYSQKDDDGDVIVQRDSYLGDIWINRIQHFKAHNAPLHHSDIENAPFSEKIEHYPYETHWNCMGNPTIVAENGKIMKGTELYSELNRCLDSTMQNLHELSDKAPDPIALALAFANDAYNAGELRLNEQLPLGERGDGLADFIVNELNDVLKDVGDDPQVIQEMIRNSLELAVRQLKEVIEHTCDNPEFEQLLIDRTNQPQRPNSYDSIKASEPGAGM